jgi:hypothetical protein
MQQSFNHTQDLQGMATGLSPRSGPEPLIRDAMEAARLAWRHTPEADYPDGYLGTTTARREDRVANAVWSNKKSYDRGAHKGERLDMSDYLWPDMFNLETGLMMEAAGSKFTSPAYNQEPVVLTNDGRPGPRDVAGMMGMPNTGVPVMPDPQRIGQLQKMRPTWR